MRAAASLALGAVLALALAPRRAAAFCRTTTVPVVADFQPSPTKCWEQGHPLFWRSSCVGYSVQRSASKQVAYDDAANGISAAFTRWTGASCPTESTGRSRVSIDVRDLGPVDCGEVNYNQSGANQNVIVFRDDSWPHSDTSNTLAITTVTFNPDTGEIFDADMEVNTHDQRVTLIDPVPGDGYDFASIVTHETGHFLGLAHSGDNRATMFASYTPGSTALRNLTSDDVAGVCSVYRPDGTRAVLDAKVTVAPQCDPSPRRGFTGACAEPPKTKTCTGSSSVAAATPVTPGWIALGVALAAALGLRRSRRVW
ncbi:MAG TPA: matrixin family metalloprotease [Labilithrix sp.]|nr:matrixin family metalloprotease [Labilithrix sp.]